MSGHRPFRSLKRKAKAMAPQVETVELPTEQHYGDCDSNCDGDRTNPEQYTDIIEPVQENDGWMFPLSWSEEDKRDWLVTHPSPQVETINIDPELDGAESGDMQADRGEYDEQEASEAEVISALKADGVYAAAIAVPTALADVVNSENYDPRQFFLVHSEVWNDMVETIASEAELGLENKELRKRVNALTRGMRKVNKHWSKTKNELKYMKDAYNKQSSSWQKYVADLEDLAAGDRKRADIFATRLARRLRKARAGRDKRERQLHQANQAYKALSVIVDRQDEYIQHLENLLTGGPIQGHRTEL